MKLIWMNGGLGNQLFQYIFYRFIEVNTGDDCYIDDSFFFRSKAHFGYEIKKIFGLSPRLLSEHFDGEEWEELLKVTENDINIIDFFGNAGLRMEAVSENGLLTDAYKNHKIPYTGKVHTFNTNAYVPDAAQFTGDVYYYGYWINTHWFQYVRDQIIHDLKFPEFDDNYNKEMSEKIQASHSVGVHVRRGDFVTLDWVLDPKWYFMSVNHMKKVISNPVFFVFSDDIAWCRSKFALLGFNESDNVVFVEGNTDGKNFRDMQLMTLCRNLVIANSSFSYLAALLNQNPNKYVLSPEAKHRIII